MKIWVYKFSDVNCPSDKIFIVIFMDKEIKCSHIICSHFFICALNLTQSKLTAIQKTRKRHIKY